MATIRKRGNAYQIRVSVGYDTNGNHKEQAMTWKPPEGLTERQIQKELNKAAVMFEEACMRGFTTKAVKFEELCEEWFEEYARLNLRNTTYERLKQLKHRIYPAIGHLRVDKITPRQLQAFINGMAKEGANENTGKPLAPKTIKHHLSLISDVFTYAVKMGIDPDTPCSKVSIPKGEVKEKQIYSQEEMALLLAKMDGEQLKYKAFFYLMAYSDFRRGEMLGLEWKDIDFENNIISVRRTSNQTAACGIYTDTTKTRRSQRTLKISPYIMGILNEIKSEQDKEALKLGDYWVDTDRLFTKDNGEPQHPNTTYTWLKRFCERNSLPFYGLHSFRHTFSTMALENGMDIKSLSSMLGHVSSATTIDIYSHITNTMQRQAAAKIDRQIGGTEAPIPQADERVRIDDSQPKIEPYKPKVRKPSTDCVTMINDNLFEGRYTPTNAYGRREAHNIYAKTREECEEKLAELIVKVKADIRAEKERLKTVNESFSLDLR